jgi:4-carboxymuconolactone decarboxylase
MTALPEPGGAAGPAPDARPAEEHERLGGRLPLLSADELDREQTQFREHLVAGRGAEAAAAGFALQLPDGRLIGPFNAYLRVPGIARALENWAAAISSYDLPHDVQQVAVLTLGIAWHSDFEVYAHTAEARHAGVPQAAIEAITAGQPPAGLSAQAAAAHRLARALAIDHVVSGELYAEALAAFGTERLIALVNLIGRYMNTAAILACFRVPAPAWGAGGEISAAPHESRHR